MADAKTFRNPGCSAVRCGAEIVQSWRYVVIVCAAVHHHAPPWAREVFLGHACPQSIVAQLLEAQEQVMETLNPKP